MKIRAISAAILLAIVIPLVFIGGIPFALLIGVVGMIAIKEITDLYKFPIIVKFMAFLAIFSIIFSNFDASTLVFGLNYKVICISLLLTLLPIIFLQVSGKYTTDDAFKLYGFIFLIGIGLNYFILIRDLDIEYFFYMLLTPIITDTFAYIGGMMIGKHKVTKLSPKKSWEGYIIGTLMGTFMMTVFYTTLIGTQKNLLIIIGITLLMSIVGQLGDLFFSAIKRHHNIKDFSKMIPGHGGILDRLDSLIFVSLIFVIFISYL